MITRPLAKIAKISGVPQPTWLLILHKTMVLLNSQAQLSNQFKL